MQIVTFKTERLSILTDQTIRFDDNGNVVIVTYFTMKVNVIPMIELKSIIGIENSNQI